MIFNLQLSINLTTCGWRFSSYFEVGILCERIPPDNLEKDFGMVLWPLFEVV